MKLYRYPEPRRPADTTRRPAPQAVEEEEAPLTGQVQGKKASNLEEMLARSLEKDDRVSWFSFRRVYGAPIRSTVGAIELDFYVNAGAEYPIQVDAEFTHKDAATRAHDSLQDMLLDRQLQGTGARPVQRLRFTGRETQEEVDAIEERLF